MLILLFLLNPIIYRREVDSTPPSRSSLGKNMPYDIDISSYTKDKDTLSVKILIWVIFGNLKACCTANICINSVMNIEFHTEYAFTEKYSPETTTQLMIKLLSTGSKPFRHRNIKLCDGLFERQLQKYLTWYCYFTAWNYFYSTYNTLIKQVIGFSKESIKTLEC